MKFFKDTINEAIQRTPAFKTKLRQMQQEFEDVFGDKIYSDKYDYDVMKDDLIKLFTLANKWLFKDKLDIDKVDICVTDNMTGYKRKGSFKLGVNTKGKHLISIVKYVKDNFFHIMNVFIHEMIHLYDSQYGPLKQKLENAYVSHVAGKELIDGYDAHGNFFMNELKRINAYGFDVHEKYLINRKLGMKKILEKQRTTNAFFDNENKKDDDTYKFVKSVYDMLKNCNKDMVYRDAKHWYIQID